MISTLIGQNRPSAGPVCCVDIASGASYKYVFHALASRFQDHKWCCNGTDWEILRRMDGAKHFLQPIL